MSQPSNAKDSTEATSLKDDFLKTARNFQDTLVLDGHAHFSSARVVTVAVAFVTVVLCSLCSVGEWFVWFSDVCEDVISRYPVQIQVQKVLKRCAVFFCEAMGFVRTDSKKFYHQFYQTC